MDIIQVLHNFSKYYVIFIIIMLHVSFQRVFNKILIGKIIK